MWPRYCGGELNGSYVVLQSYRSPVRYYDLFAHLRGIEYTYRIEGRSGMTTKPLFINLCPPVHDGLTDRYIADGRIL